jgi:dynein heavy chain
MASRSDPDPLKTVLFQELDRYNKLLSSLSRNLTTIIKVTNGTASTTAELEEVMLSLAQQKVPRIWGSTYPSQKPLGSWMRDLSERVAFFYGWVNDQLPMCWWLPAMTYPTGVLIFLYALLAVVYVSHVEDRLFNTPCL